MPSGVTLNSCPPKASLLGLPIELRLLIYDILVFSEPQNTSGHIQWESHWEDDAWIRVATEPRALKPVIPWVNLILTSRQLASELRSPSWKAHAGHTWKLQGHWTQYLSHPLSFSSIPCSPPDVKVVIVDLDVPIEHIRDKERGWEPSFEVFRTIHSILKRGPMIHGEKLLPACMRLDQLVIRDTTADEKGYRPGESVAKVKRFMEEITRITTLWERVNMVKFIYPRETLVFTRRAKEFRKLSAEKREGAHSSVFVRPRGGFKGRPREPWDYTPFDMTCSPTEGGITHDLKT